VRPPARRPTNCNLTSHRVFGQQHSRSAHFGYIQAAKRQSTHQRTERERRPASQPFEAIEACEEASIEKDPAKAGDGAHD